MTAPSQSTTVRAAGLDGDHPLDPVLASRADILAMTEAAMEAALNPKDPGGLSRGLRAALACRMAKANGADALAAQFADRMDTVDTDSAERRAAEPAYDGSPDRRLAALIRHTDIVTLDTKSVTGADIEALSAAGVSEDDIVRLSELTAFVNYQARVVRGLQLLGAMA